MQGCAFGNRGNMDSSRDGQEYRRGTSAEPHSAMAQTAAIAHIIGEFQGKAGEAYQLQVTLTADAPALAAAHPRLKVVVASIAYTDLQSAGLLAFSMAFICLLFGANPAGDRVLRLSPAIA